MQVSRTRIVVVSVLVAGLLSSCGAGGGGPKKPSYTPVADQDLYARIARLPGVTRVDVSYTDTFTSTNSYAGNVYVTAKAPAEQVLVKALAILWQGHPGAAMTGVAVAPPGKVQLFPSDLGLESRTSFVQKFGPQPGDGKP
ncbi:MAG: hypothetical protein ACR2FG_05820 [Marmoricola sp.]